MLPPSFVWSFTQESADEADMALSVGSDGVWRPLAGGAL